MMHDNHTTRLLCPICCDDVGAEPLGDGESAKEKLADSPCKACVEHMKQGVILISVRDGEKGPNPYRTGCFAVVKDKLIDRMVSNEVLKAQILEARVTFIDDRSWDFFGLPRKAH